MMRALVAASRPLSWVNTAYPFAAAFVLTMFSQGAEYTPRSVLALAVGTVFFLVPYNLAMYGINDVFDYASDQNNPRKGGAQGALLAPAVHRRVLVASAIACVPFVIVLVALGGPASWVVLAVSLFAVVAYSAPPLRSKEVPVLDSVTSSTHFVSPAVYGLVLAGEMVGADPLISPLAALVLGAFFLWGMASHAFGAVQDVVPDRAGGIASIATALGARVTVRVAIVLWALAGALLLFGDATTAGMAAFVVPYIATAAPFWNITDDTSADANRGWRRFLWINYAVGAALTFALIFRAYRQIV